MGDLFTAFIFIIGLLCGIIIADARNHNFPDE